jgi:hypothetical protein
LDHGGKLTIFLNGKNLKIILLPLLAGPGKWNCVRWGAVPHSSLLLIPTHFIVRFDDILYELMAHNVLLRKFNEANSGNMT